MPMALEIVSEYAKDIAPFLAAILKGLLPTNRASSSGDAYWRS
jgi:hypothetical protein